MEVEITKFDGTYKDKRKGFKSVSYRIKSYSDIGSARMGHVFVTVKKDMENKQVGIKKLLIVPCLDCGTVEQDIYLNYDGLAYFFNTDTPKMCSSVEDIRTDLLFIMEFAMKMVGGVHQLPRVGMYMLGAIEPTVIDRSSIDKRFFTYEHDFCRHWILQLLPKKLMKLTEPKPKKPEIDEDEEPYKPLPDYRLGESDFQSVPIHPDGNDNPPLTTL